MKQTKKTSRKPVTRDQSIHIRIDSETKQAIADAALDDRKTLSDFIISTMIEKIKK